jgi:outer membrane protein OmpA-like peptidoglycan-associated protein
MNRLFLSTIITAFSVITATALFAQDLTKKEFIRSVQEADMAYYYDEDYERAASLYEPLLKTNPGNSNIAAKLGICYLNIDGKKKDALRLLLAASKNVVSQEKEYTEYGEKAQIDSYLYLALAYHMNDSLEKAILLYNDIKQKLGKTEIFREGYLDKQISDCMYAMEMKKKPLTIISELFVPWLTKYPGACNPVISKNDSVFVFTQKSGGKTRILCSYKKGDWNTPVDITRSLGGYDRFYSNSITGDGKTLVLCKDDGGDGNLYFSERKDSTWSRAKGAGRNINSIYWESHGFITPDGKKLYFSSNRTGGVGELDIWSATKNNDGSWNQPVNLGNTINTAYNEDTPYFDPASGTLIFSSAGHRSMGGYDLFTSVLKNNNWTDPAGMPFAFNTILDNTFIIPGNNSSGFVASLYNEADNSRNVYTLTARDPADEITMAEGIISLSDGLTPEPGKISVRLSGLKKTSSPISISVNMEGRFIFSVKPGDYQLDITYPGYKSDIKTLNIPLYFQGHYMSLISTLVPEEVAEGKFLAIRNILFAFNSAEIDPQAIPVLEDLKSILISHPELKIEVAGYTDALGTPEYNLRLADKRCRAIVDYLKSAAIPASRFVMKAFGESDFIAVNVNEDGSDNPEGRKYNRRVEFGIVDPQTGVTISQDTYTPEHLRLPSSMKYSIVLIKSARKLSPEKFNALSLEGKLFMRSIESDTLSVYAVGVFYNRPDAVKYLGYVRESGFNEAYIINQYDLNNEAKTLSKRNLKVSLATGKRIYTIQLLAVKSPVSMDIFKDIKGVREILDDDGYYKYMLGEYETFSQAQEAIKPVYEAGFKDATIRELNSLITE